MLRLVSVIGIALAMVVGFVALSSQMRDEFYIRTKVSAVAAYMKNVAEQELQCNNATLVPALPSTNPQPSSSSGNQPTQRQPGAAASNSASDTANETGAEPDVSLSKPAIVSRLDTTARDDGSVKLVAFFTDVQGESGKLRIKSGRHLTLICHCAAPDNSAVKCQTTGSDLNKNYVPGKIVNIQ